MCDSGDSKGFRTLNDPINYNKLTTVNSSPITLAFDPSCVSSLYGNKIVPINTTQNTCTIDLIKYTLDNIQICKSIHKYKNTGENKDPVAELILSFYKTMSDNTSDILLFCLPIYISDQEKYSGYLNNIDLTNCDQNSSLSSLFVSSKESQSGLKYTSCFSKKSKLEKVNIYVFSGIRITQNKFNDLTAKLCKKDTLCISLQYTFKEYVMPNDLSYAETSFITCSAEFAKTMNYYTTPITIPSKIKPTGTYNHYKMNQYKCVPFDRLNDLKKDNVPSLYDITTMQDNAEIIPMTTTSDSISTDGVIEIIAIVAAVPIVIVMIGAAASFIL